MTGRYPVGYEEEEEVVHFDSDEEPTKEEEEDTYTTKNKNTVSTSLATRHNITNKLMGIYHMTPVFNMRSCMSCDAATLLIV